MVWYSHLFQNFPQFIVIHTAKGFGVVNKAEIDVFLELLTFLRYIKSVFGAFWKNILTLTICFLQNKIEILLQNIFSL